MDNVNIESTLNYIEKLDKKIIDEIDSIAFENNGLYKEGQKLLQVLNYSPKVIKQTREKIKNLKNIEIPQLSELENLDYSKLVIDPVERHNKRVHKIVTQILNLIIDKALSNIKEEKDEKGDIKKEKSGKLVGEDNFKINNSSEKIIKGDIFYEIKVFLFNKDDFIKIKITKEDSIKAIKERIINKIVAEKDYEIKYSSEKDYELRTLEEMDDKFNTGFFPIEDAKFIINNNIKSISFLKNDILKNDIFKVKSSKL